jgi:hypothetical protein
MEPAIADERDSGYAQRRDQVSGSRFACGVHDAIVARSGFGVSGFRDAGLKATTAEALVTIAKPHIQTRNSESLILALPRIDKV